MIQIWITICQIIMGFRRGEVEPISANGNDMVMRHSHTNNIQMNCKYLLNSF